MVCQRGLFSLFAPPMPMQEVPPRLSHPVQCVPPELPWVTLGLWASRESFFCVSQASASLASEESHTVPRSGRNKFIFYLFSSSFLIGKTNAFLLSEPCLTLLSSIPSLPQEKN